MQEVDAERRVQQLRGIKVDPLPALATEEEERAGSRQSGTGRERKRRRVAGEDDTDRDIRFARENNALVPIAEMQMKSQKNSEAPIVDHSGHINLFPTDGPKSRRSKNAEAEAEKAKKQKEHEDQYTMRFSNAAGFKQAIGEKPWYQTIGNDQTSGVEKPSKDVWGNEDPRRRERQKTRIAADDPLAAIKKGVAGVREVEGERKKWREERKREIKELEEADRRRQRHEKKRRRRRREEKDDLEDFSLGPPVTGQDSRRPLESSRDHSHQHRIRSDERSRHHSHHGHHRSLGMDDRPGWEVGVGGRYSNQFAQT
jgi:hypothetical protein